MGQCLSCRPPRYVIQSMRTCLCGGGSLAISVGHELSSPYLVRRCGHTCQRPSIGISIVRAAKTALAAAYPSGPGARMCGRKCLSYKLEQTNKPSAAMLGIATCQSARALSTIAVPAAPDAHRTPLRSERSEFSSPKQYHGIFRRGRPDYLTRTMTSGIPVRSIMCDLLRLRFQGGIHVICICLRPKVQLSSLMPSDSSRMPYPMPSSSCGVVSFVRWTHGSILCCSRRH
jgi:hypothetical protein